MSEEMTRKFDIEVRKFEEVYHHMHTGGFGFEFFCYARWFFIKEYMEKDYLILAH